MAVYIEDEETSQLISRFAELRHTNKTRALRELLRRELSVLERKATAEQRYRKIMNWLDSLPATSNEAIPKQHYDWLNGDIKSADLSPDLRKELGIKKR